MGAAWIADAVWQPVWGRYVKAIARLTAGWPAVIADRVGAISRAQAYLLVIADGGLIAPKTPGAPECDRAAVLLRELLADPSGWPHDEREVLALAAARDVSEWILRRSLLQRGIATRDGALHRPEPGRRYWFEPETIVAVRELDMAEAMRGLPAPVMRPLLDDLCARLEAERVSAELASVLRDPAPSPLPPAPKTSAVAREQWLTTKAAATRLRISVRRGHTRRAPLCEMTEGAISAARAAWWSWHSHVLPAAGDSREALKRANALRAEILERLEAGP